MESTPKNLITQLLKISKIDASLASIKAERKKLEDGIASTLAAIKKDDIERQSKTKIHDDKKARYQKEEKRIRDERDKLIARRKALTSLGNYKLQQAAEKEIDHASRQIGTQEEGLYTVLEELEKLSGEIKVLEDNISALRASYDRTCTEAKETVANLEDRSQRYLQERAELVKDIDSRSLTTYERIRDKFVMDPVVEVKGGNSCAGCFMQLGPQVVVQISRGDSVVRCPGCGRILYIAEKEDKADN